MRSIRGTGLGRFDRFSISKSKSNVHREQHYIVLSILYYSQMKRKGEKKKPTHFDFDSFGFCRPLCCSIVRNDEFYDSCVFYKIILSSLTSIAD